MTKYLTLVANFFYPFRSVLLALCVAAIIAIFYVFLFVEVNIQEQYLRVALLSLLWCLLLYVLSHSFYSEQDHEAARSFFAKVKQRIIGVVAFIFSVLFLGLVVATLHISVKLLTV